MRFGAASIDVTLVDNTFLNVMLCYVILLLSNEIKRGNFLNNRCSL